MFRISQKSIDCLKCASRIDILEGGGRTSKTTTAIVKFGARVSASNNMQFMIAAADGVVAYRNLLDNRLGFLDIYSNARKGTDTSKGQHLIFLDCEGREKIIYIVGFRDKARWQKILGSTIGGILIDEINLADPDFIAQVYRSGGSVEDWFLLATLNPANPDLEIYSQLINRTRPLKKYANQIPPSIIAELKRIPFKDVLTGGVYWHFNFADNPVMTEDKIAKFKEMYPPGSFYYGSLINGERGVTEGAVFGKSLNDKQIVNAYINDTHPDRSWQDHYREYAIGIDLGNNDVKRGTIMTFTAIKKKYEAAMVLDSYQCKATEANQLVEEICQKIKEWYLNIENLGQFKGVFIDGYGVIELIMPTIRKRLVALGLENIRVELCVKFGEEGGRGPRMMLVLILLTQNRLLFNSQRPGALETKRQLAKIVYDPKTAFPLDENKIENDYYDSLCYTLTPFLTKFNERLYLKLKEY